MQAQGELELAAVEEPLEGRIGLFGKISQVHTRGSTTRLVYAFNDSAAPQTTLRHKDYDFQQFRTGGIYSFDFCRDFLDYP